jgi:hypothetical protein
MKAHKKAPSTNIQTPEKLQASNIKQLRDAFETWFLVLLRMLEL